jgi:hypothetical protein
MGRGAQEGAIWRPKPHKPTSPAARVTIHPPLSVPHGANRCGQVTCHPGRTSSPLRPSLSFWYTQELREPQRLAASEHLLHLLQRVEARVIAQIAAVAVRPCDLDRAAGYDTQLCQIERSVRWAAHESWGLKSPRRSDEERCIQKRG